MSSIPYYQRAAPFWDWVANLEEQGLNHPFHAGPHGSGRTPEGQGPFAQPLPQNAWPFNHWGPFPHRGPPGQFPHGGPSGQFPHMGPPGQFESTSGDENEQTVNEQLTPGEDEKITTPTEDDDEATPTPGDEQSGRRRRGGPGRHHHHGRHFGRYGRGGFGGGEEYRGRGGRRGGPCRIPNPNEQFPWDFSGRFSNFLQNQIFGHKGNESQESNDFKPDADVFETQSAFVIHVSLAGAQKEDVAVNWDSDKSEVIISGVIHRPGNEEFLKTLAMGERKIGAFERKIRLGSPAHPAAVDMNGITAKLEDGVLRVQIPKEDKEFVNVMKVDVE